MIPKTIHYCWFGRGELPELTQMCIASWKKYLPDYTIKEWNEDNFDLNLYPFTKEAYDARKFAFVADVVRLYALSHEGGVYMDTDVEVLKPLDPFLHHAAFTGFETEKILQSAIMGSEKGGKWVCGNLRYYENRHFIQPDETLDMTPNTGIMTNDLSSFGLKSNNTFQEIPDFLTLYPSDYFSPKSSEHYKTPIMITKNTVVIHHFMGSWHAQGLLGRLLGDNGAGKLQNFMYKLFGVKRFAKLIRWGRKASKYISFVFKRPQEP